MAEVTASVRRRRVLEFEAHSKVDWLIRGHGAGQLLIEATGRPQVWSSTRRGYSVQERTALDVLALSERYGIDAVITGPRGARGVASPAIAGEAAEPEISLW